MNDNMKRGKMKGCFVLILLFCVMKPVWGHSDVIMTNKYGNVEVWCQFGFNRHEERFKALIIGQLVEILSREMDYRQPIVLSFKHSYVDDIVPRYKLQCRRGSTGDTLLFNLEAKTYNATKTLQLIEHGIKNKESVFREQRDTTFETRYWGPHTETSLDRAKIDKVLNRKVSFLVNKVLANKIYRPKDNHDKISERFMYYYQNNKYHIFYKKWDGCGRVLLELDNIYQFGQLVYPAFVLSSRCGVIFDTDSTFYVLTRDNMSKEEDARYFISKRHTVTGVKDVYEPFHLVEIGERNVIIGVRQFFKPERNLLYRAKDDYLIQNLDTFVDKFKEVDK